MLFSTTPTSNKENKKKRAADKEKHMPKRCNWNFVQSIGYCIIYHFWSIVHNAPKSVKSAFGQQAPGAGANHALW